MLSINNSSICDGSNSNFGSFWLLLILIAATEGDIVVTLVLIRSSSRSSRSSSRSRRHAGAPIIGFSERYCFLAKYFILDIRLKSKNCFYVREHEKEEWDSNGQLRKQ